MSRLTTTDTGLAGLRLVHRQPMGDSRGFLARLFCSDALADAGWTKPIAQINHTHTATQGTVRGMHFQRPPHAEMKLVSCIRGAVWDVAIDLRMGSPSFLRWHAAQLSADNGCALLIPEGFAHGFQALTDDCELIYLHSAPYTAHAEDGLSATDPMLGIQWPMPIALQSIRDQQLPGLTPAFNGLDLNA